MIIELENRAMYDPDVPVRIIFLDIDGVLNHVGTYNEGAPWRRTPGEKLRVPVDPDCMARLNRLVAQTGASIVISSSWRLFARYEELGPALAQYGLLAEVIGETPDLVNDPTWFEAWRAREVVGGPYERIERGMEIAEWLARHPGVASFVILDDASDMGNLRSRLIHTDPIVGLDDPDVDRARQLLIGEPSVVETVAPGDTQRIP